MLTKRQDWRFGRLIVFVCLLLGTVAVLGSCYVYDWSSGEDDYTTTDDDTAGDDDNDDNDDTSTCEDIYSFMYVDCDWVFTDEASNEIALEDVITWCEAGEADYAADGDLAMCIADSTCDEIPDCL